MQAARHRAAAIASDSPAHVSLASPPGSPAPDDSATPPTSARSLAGSAEQFSIGDLSEPFSGLLTSPRRAPEAGAEVRSSISAINGLHGEMKDFLGSNPLFHG